MTKERSAFNNDYSCKFISLSSFRETNFNVGTCLNLSLILQAFNLDMLEIKDVDSTWKIKLTSKNDLLKVSVENSSWFF